MSDTPTPWGATAADWSLFADRLGLVADLLPVVSNPKATISRNSKMAALGKTPSQYNRDREAVGISEWTQRRSDDRAVKRWAADSDLGICVQTRSARAIDIDIPDPAVARRVVDLIELYLEQELPTRWRADSGKCLLALTLPGDYVKRIIRTEHGAIEFLANGQQFVAVGTHPKGERYQWRWPDGVLEFPTVAPAAFEGLWQALQDAFGIEPAATGRGIGARPAVPREAGAASDAVVDFLEATGWVKNWQKDGRVNIRCPWEAEHTSDSGDTATVWFPAGVGGFEQGHFRCLHAHCENRSDQDFLDAVEYVQSGFDVVDPAADTPPGEPVERPKPVYQRKRNGAILGNIWNVKLALQRPDVALRHIAFDEFRAEVVVAAWSEGQSARDLQWRSFTDNDYTDLKLHLEGPCAFETISKENLRDAVHWVADRNCMDTAIEWLRHRVAAWDGKLRIDRFYSTYLGAADTEYTRACGAYTWTALAGRVLVPGVKADMVPVLISDEGTGKSSSVELMVPSSDHYVEIDLSKRDDDLSRAMRGKLIGELGELRGLQTRDEESIRQWVTRKWEEWTPKYREFAVKFARRLLFMGTANNGEFLPNDGSAARRWLPLPVGLTKFDALARDREQLWAEARERFLAGGVEWEAANELGREVRNNHRHIDDWQEVIEAWLLLGPLDDPAGEPRGAGPITTTEVLAGAIGIPVKGIGRKEQERAARILKALGYARKKARVQGSTQWAFVPTQACEFLHVRNVQDLA